MTLLRYVPRETYDDLDNKINALTDQPSLYELYDVVGVIGHARGSHLDLDDAIKNIIKSASDEKGKLMQGVQNVSQIEVYADRLTAMSPVRPPPTCDVMTLITRVAFAEGKPVRVELSGNPTEFMIELHCELPASPIKLSVQFPNGKPPVRVTIDPARAKPEHRFWGLTVGVDGTSSVGSSTDAHTITDLFENSTRSIADMIQDDEKLSDMGWDNYNDNLRRLLNYQLLLASKVEDQDRTLAYQIADFVVNVCQGIPKAFDLYSQASVMATSKVVGQEAMMTALVPKLDLSTAQQVLKSRIDSAAAFDSAYMELQGQEANSKNVRLFANIALEKSIDSDQVYAFMTDTAEDRLWSAQGAFSKAEREFQALQMTLKNNQEAFKEGIEAWKTEQTWAIVGEVFTAIAAVAGGIALACVAPPAGAEALGAGAAELGSAIKGAEEAAGAWQEIMDIADRIKEIYEKIEPYLEKVQELVESVSKIVDLIKGKSSMDEIGNDDIDGLNLPTITGDDTVNSTADWDIFQVEMNKLYEGIKDQGIGGADEFFLTITKMVIRGKAIFAAQTALISASGAYLTVMQQSIAQQKHTDRLRKAIPQIQGNEKAFGIIKLAMAERLLALRSWIVLDFRQYLAAYAWNCLDARRPIVLDPMKDIASFLNDAATLQAASAQVYANVRAQTRVFYLSSGQVKKALNGNAASNGNDSVVNEKVRNSVFLQSEDLPESLRNYRTASFALDCENPIFQNYGRLRVRKARIFLQHSGANENNIVSLRVTLGAAMKDLSLEKIKTPTTGPGSVTAPRVLHFVTTESTFGFEYMGKDKEVLMDGAFCGYYESSSLLLSPFRAWTVAVDSETNLESVTGLTLELTCEVTYL